MFGLVLAGPEAPVTAGRRVVLAGLAPAGTASVTLQAGPELTVKPREDGSFALRFTVSAPGTYRAAAGGSRALRRASSSGRSCARAAAGACCAWRRPRAPGAPSS